LVFLYGQDVSLKMDYNMR